MTIAISLDDRPVETGAGARHAVVRATMRLLGAQPLHELDLAGVAAQAGVPVREVERAFGDLNGVLLAAIEEWYVVRGDQSPADPTRDGALTYLRSLLRSHVEDTVCARAVMTAAAIAGTPGHPAAEQLHQMWVRFHAVVQRALAHDVLVGREPDTMDPAAGAEQALALYEGLQLQRLFRPHLDLLASWDRAVARLRHGWSERYEAPLYEI